MAFARITICGLSECFIHHHGILYNVAPGQRIHFTTKEAQQWVHPWNTLILSHNYHSEAVSLQEWWDSLLNSQCLLRGGLLAYKVKNTPYQQLLYNAVPSVTKVHGFRNQGGNENASPQYYT